MMCADSTQGEEECCSGSLFFFPKRRPALMYIEESRNRAFVLRIFAPLVPLNKNDHTRSVLI